MPLPEEKKPARTGYHSLHMDNREKISLTGVTEVESFDENAVYLATCAGNIIISGKQLHISKLNIEDGQLAVDGQIISVAYEDKAATKGGLFSKLFR